MSGVCSGARLVKMQNFIYDSKMYESRVSSAVTHNVSSFFVMGCDFIFSVAVGSGRTGH